MQSTDVPQVVLTFDVEHPDQPAGNPEGVGEILANLREQTVKGTFFVQGSWGAAYPALTRRIVDDGHLLGLHSHWHAPYTSLTQEGIVTDIERGRTVLQAITGVDPAPWFRLPYGRGLLDVNIRRRLRDHGFVNVLWNIDPCDWDATASVGSIAQAILEGLAWHQSGPAIVLCHAWSSWTAAALPKIIQATVGQRRYVTLSEVNRVGLKRLTPGREWRRPDATAPFPFAHEAEQGAGQQAQRS